MSDDIQEATEFMKERPKVDERKIIEMRDGLAQKVDKWANRIQFSMAFTPKVIRREGEHWTDSNGKHWEMKGGIAQSVSTTQDAKMPWWCPQCKKPMNHRFDPKFYYSRNKCWNCVVEDEGQMRLDGTWDKYEKQMMRANEVAFIKDTIAQHIDYIRTFRPPQAHFENGTWEEIAPREEFQMLFDKLEADIEFCLARLEIIRKEEEAENAE